MGCAGRNSAPEKRGVISGWSAGAVRRHTRWLYSVDAPALTGWGYALTLTLRDCPPDAETWQRLRRAWIMRQERAGLLRLHWLTEWQRRGVPHMHVALYFDRELTPRERWAMLEDWLAIAGEFRASWRSQDVKPIDGPLGWLQYLSKHAARGVRHYQRWAKPAGWEKTGRLWGHVGEWPTEDPLSVDLSPAEAFRFRRLVRSYRVASARAEGLQRGRWARLPYARRMLRCGDPTLSRVRGLSEWCPEHVAVAFLDLVLPTGIEDGDPLAVPLAERLDAFRLRRMLAMAETGPSIR